MGGNGRTQRDVSRGDTEDVTEDSEVSSVTPRGRDSQRTRPERDVTRGEDSTREPKDATREPRDKSRDDSTREPCDEDKTGVTGEAEATEAPSDIPPRRNLRNRGNGRTRPQLDVSRGDNEDVIQESEESSEDTLRSRDSQRTRPERDVTRDDDNTQEARDVTRETSNRDEDSAEAPLLGRLLRRNGDNTREPKDATREPCVDCGSGRGRGDSDKSSDESVATDIPRRLLQEATEIPEDSTKEPCDRTREPCVGDDYGRKGRKRGRKARKGEEDSTDASEEVPELRRALGRDGRRGSRMGLGATISDGNVDFAGVTGEVVFGDVDEATESIPLTLTIGETTFQCNVEVRGSKEVSCIAVSDNDFRVRVGCELELEN